MNFEEIENLVIENFDLEGQKKGIDVDLYLQTKMEKEQRK
jgi:hypothetical protein